MSDQRYDARGRNHAPKIKPVQQDRPNPGSTTSAAHRAMEPERRRQRDEKAAQDAAQAHERRADKALRPGSPEWRSKVNR